MTKTGSDNTARGSKGTSDPTTKERVNRLLNQGARLLAEQLPQEAIIRLEEAYALDPHNVAVAINLGGAYVMQGRYTEAVPILEAACHVEPDNPMIWTNLAAAYLGNLSEATPESTLRAIAAYERAIELNPMAPNVNYNLGLIYKRWEEREKAAAHFWRAIEVNPNDKDAKKLLKEL
ncbi:MAG: tetratricopeptide repeat protein [Anaerolineae bacterium]